jgi:hypothetical protein
MADVYLSAAQRMEARLRRQYPWRNCDEEMKKRFFVWQGKRLNKMSKDPSFGDYEMGYRNALNAEKTDLELEKLMVSWEIFDAEEKQREQEAARGAIALPPDQAQSPMPTITKQDHLARLSAMWQHPKQHQFVRDRIAANPEWGIKLGADGPELA